MAAESSSSVEAFTHAYEVFHLGLAEGNALSCLSCVGAMRTAVLDLKSAGDPSADVRDEMVADCERKAGDAVVEYLRSLCKEGRQRLANGDTGDEDSEVEAQVRHDTFVGVCFAAVGLGKSRSVQTLWGGLLRARLKHMVDSSLKTLSSSRALRRFQKNGNAAGGEGDADDDNVNEVGDGAHPQDPHPHTTALASVLGFTSKLMERVSTSGLGGETELPILQQLHEECSQAAVTVLGWMREDCAIDWWCQRMESAIKSVKNSPCPNLRDRKGIENGQENRPEPFDACGTDFVVDEVAFACQIVQCYLDFASARGISDNLQATELFTRLQLCLGAYITLEDAYCLLSVAEAMRIAEPIEVEDGVWVSSVVEDAGFLLLKSLERSVATHSEQAIMATLNRISDVLDPSAPPPSFFGALQLRVSHAAAEKSPPKSGNSAPSSAGGDAGFRAALALALEEAVDDGTYHSDSTSALGSMILLVNSAQASLSTLNALREAVLLHLEASNPLTQTLLEQMVTTVNAYKNLRDANLGAVLGEVYPPLIGDCKKNWCTAGSAGYRYAPSSVEYEVAAAQDESPWVSTILQAVKTGPVGNACLKGMQSQAFELFLNRIATCICEDLEKLLVLDCGVGSISEWGALLFQHEVRMLQGGLASLLDAGTLSEPFNRLNHVCLLLTLDHPSDVHMYNVPQKLMTDNEIRAIIMLRADFDPKLVRGLKFSR